MDTQEEVATASVSRRGVLRGATTAACLCAGGVVLASCSSGSDGSGTPTEKDLKGEKIAKSDAVPVGGGKIFSDEKVVVTQPKKGDFKAFSAICTHQGCLVDTVADGLIQCPCHGSEYSIRDGSAQDGPAPKPLREYPVKVKDGKVVVT
ncbi:MAG: Rieske (2Fe-2S) protein [Streptosporangiaceae bacterium]